GSLCVRRSILKGPLSGLISGFGAALADTLFACIAAFGLTQVADLLIQHQGWLKLGGGGFLCAIGIHHIATEPKAPPRGPRERGRLGDFMSSFLLTLTNPVTILALAAIFAAVGFVDEDFGLAPTTALVGGVFAGSAAWWLLLAGIAMPLRDRLDPNHLEWVGRVAGILLLASGFYVLASIALPHLI